MCINFNYYLLCFFACIYLNCCVFYFYYIFLIFQPKNITKSPQHVSALRPTLYSCYLANSDEPMSENLLTTDHEQTGLPENADRSADRAVQDMLEKAREKEPTHGRRKYTTTFTAEDRAKVGKYAAKNGIVKAQRYFKELKLSKSTVR